MSIKGYKGQLPLMPTTKRKLKSHKGTLTEAEQFHHPSWEEGTYIYVGRFKDHPQFAGSRGHTSQVVWEQPHHPGQPFEIETLNSRYTIVPNEPAVASEGSKPQS